MSTKLGKTEEIPIDTIDVSAQVRDINEDVVKEYAEAMEKGDKFPPVEVMQAEDDDDALLTPPVLVDGRHRLEAAKHNGNDTIKCKVKRGTMQDARLAAAGCNATHGLRRTNEDKRRAVEVVLEIQDNWTDSRIAMHCGVSPTFVGKVRAQFNASKGTADQPQRRVASDGRVFKDRARAPARTEGEGADGDATAQESAGTPTMGSPTQVHTAAPGVGAAMVAEADSGGNDEVSTENLEAYCVVRAKEPTAGYPNGPQADGGGEADGDDVVPVGHGAPEDEGQAQQAVAVQPSNPPLEVKVVGAPDNDNPDGQVSRSMLAATKALKAAKDAQVTYDSIIAAVKGIWGVE